MRNTIIDENNFVSEIKTSSEDVMVQPEDTCFDDNWQIEIDFDIQNVDNENDEEIPF